MRRHKGIRGSRSFFIPIFILLIVLTYDGFDSAKAATTTSCGWDTSSGWVARENAKVGNANWAKGIPPEYSGDYMSSEAGVTPQWGKGNMKSVGGWLDSASGTCGDQIGLHLTGNGRPVTIKIYRMGYYGGAGARLITSTSLAAVKAGAKPTITKAPTSTVSTTWPVAWSLKINRATIPGQYILRLDDGGPDSSFVPLTIVDPTIKSSITLVAAILTWQAYNQWGGYSLYKGPNMTRGTRSTIVSFNRPYDGDGSGQFRYMEYPVLKIAERLGLDMNYITDFELDRNIASLTNTKSILFGGHAEYWTANMRTNTQAAVDRGVNLVSLGGNAAYAHPRLQANNRQLVMWRASLADPKRNDPLLATTSWRAFPISQPEAKILGAQYVGLGVSADYTIPHPNRWPFTTMTHPSLLKSIVGREVDSPLYSIGPAVEVLADAAINFHGKAVTIMATYYTNSKKAGVIDISTNGWTCAIDDICPWHPQISKDTKNDAKLITEEILKGLTKGPLGIWRPAIIDIQARTKISARQRI
jgi:hypothetical protein